MCVSMVSLSIHLAHFVQVDRYTSLCALDISQGICLNPGVYIQSSFICLSDLSNRRLILPSHFGLYEYLSKPDSAWPISESEQLLCPPLLHLDEICGHCEQRNIPWGDTGSNGRLDLKEPNDQIKDARHQNTQCESMSLWQKAGTGVANQLWSRWNSLQGGILGEISNYVQNTMAWNCPRKLVFQCRFSEEIPMDMGSAPI